MAIQNKIGRKFSACYCYVTFSRNIIYIEETLYILSATICLLSFPFSLSVVASWNRNLASEVGKIYPEEWRARGIHFMLAPGVNIYRTSKGARNFEYYGEDPYLPSEMVVPFIQSVQEGGVISMVKHFVGNDQEYDRYTVSTEVSDKALHEIYLAPFKAAVQKAGVKAVMTGYSLGSSRSDNLPAYCFGHGLSYTTFEYSDLKMDSVYAITNNSLNISFKVKNTGVMKGKEVSMLFVRDCVSSVVTPLNLLKQFTKIELEPGEEKVVNFEIPM